MARRFFGYGELPLVCLALLAAGPASAYELMGELARLFAPAYRPSPGSVYPALRALVDGELVEEAASHGTATRYRVTPRGMRALADRRDDLAVVELRTGRSLGREGAVEGALARVGARVRALAGRVPDELIVTQLECAVRQLEQAAAGTGGNR